MSKRRSISFKENERDLMKYYDENGKSDLAKDALRFYRDNKNKVISDEMKVEILKMIKNNTSQPISHSSGTSADLQSKIGKLKR